jgi:CheY-like chemotaxis protein
MNYKILIIEDELKTSELLSNALSIEGFSVECAENGIVGLKKLKQSHFDLIVLDIKMPDKNGDEVLKEIREINPFIPVVVYTNYPDKDIMQKLINLGVDGFLDKGASADLWSTVDFIKLKLIPIGDEKRKELLNKMFNDLKKPNSDEILS